MLFKYYDYIVTVAKYNNISKAAKELFVSQSTLSRMINRLEEELGITIFDRSRNPLTLTPAGECYLRYTGEMVALKKKMLQELNTLNPERKSTITIGFSISYSCDFLPYILPEFYQKYPNTKIIVKEMPTGYLEENLLKNTLDLAVLCGNTFADNLNCEYLETQRILLIVPKNHPLYYKMNGMTYATLGMEDMQKLNNEPFITLAPNEGMRIVSDYFFKKYHITPNIVMEAPDTATAYSLAVSGIGLTLISDLRVLLPAPNVYFTDFCCYQLGNPPFTRTRVVAYPTGNTLSPAEEYFIHLSKKNINQLYVHALQNYSKE